MNKITRILFVAGLLLEIFAFLISNTSNLPWMHRLLSPTYYKAQKALQKLDSKKELIQTDYGFQEVIKKFREKAMEEGHPEVSEIPVIKIVRGNPRMGFSANSAGVTTPIDFHLESGKTVGWYMEEIIEKIETLRTKNLFWWGASLFLIGIILQVVGRIIENKKPLTNQSR